ncbi:FAD binding domain-containing protein [Curvivirga sp.]|uniref:FAD binding domain-containing protein n=1 Tax=Curvivirga sp. TaxID=2856848 RepID=UPI003B5C4E72
MRYEAPTTVEAAVSLLSAEAGLAKVLSGGTDLLVQMRMGMVEPDLIVDTKRIPGFGDIVEENGGYRVGGAVPSAELNEHAGFTAMYPGVAEGADLIGSTQVQGRATITGNLCNAGPAADSVPCAVAVGCVARIAGPNGTRDVAIEDIPQAPGKTSLEKGELVESLFFPAKPANTGDAYLRFIPRTEMDIAVAGCGISITLDDAGTCTAAKVAIGAVAIKVLVVDEAAQALIGTKVDDAALEALASACSEAAKPITDKRGTVEFRKEVVGVLAKRAAKIALDRAKGA